MIRGKFHKVCQVAIVKLLWLKLIVLKESKPFSKFMLYGVLTLYTLRSVFIFPILFLYISYGNDKENLFDDQELLELVIISYVLITFIFNSWVRL